MKNPAANRSTRFPKVNRANPTTQSARKAASLRTRVPILGQGGPQTSSTTASTPTPPAAQMAPPVPAVEPRLRIDADGNYVEIASSAHAPVVRREDFPATVPTYNRELEVFCSKCSHDGCAHYHLPYERLSRVEAQGFLNFTENTLFTKHSRDEMPHAVAGPPLEFDAHSLAAFKFDFVVIPGRRAYDRASHLAAIPAAQMEHERRRREKSEKLSAHMRRRHAAARKAATRRSEISRPSSTRRAIKAGGAR